MTCREKLKMEHPTCIDDRCCGGCYGCPDHYNYMGKPEYCPYDRNDGVFENAEVTNDLCAKCWGREIPEKEEESDE